MNIRKIILMVFVMLMLPLPVLADEDTIVETDLTVDDQKPGNDNIFDFILCDDSMIYQTVQNDADGKISFNVSELENGTYYIREYPSQSQKDSHSNMTFDERIMSITLSGSSSSEGASWLKNGELYFAYGGIKGPIIVKNADQTKQVYAYCIYNQKQTPEDFWNNKTQYKAIIPVTSLSTYAQDSGASLDKIKKVIYHYTVNPPATSKDWDNVEIIISSLSSGTTLNSSQTAMLNTCLKETVPDNFVLVLLLPFGNNRSSYDQNKAGTYDSRMQNLITGYLVGDKKVTYDKVSFANKTITKSPVSFNLSATKKLDGSTPDNQIFQFQLLDENDTVLQTKENDSSGLIKFADIEISEAGIYNYKIKEINGGDINIKYDDHIYQYEVEVLEEDLFNTVDNEYYATMDDKCYVSTVKDTKDFPVYNISNDLKDEPYQLIEDPGEDVLETYINSNRYGKRLKEIITKTLYYLQLDDDNYSLSEKNNIVKYVCGDEGSDYRALITTVEQLSLPDYYELMLFIKDDSLLLGAKGVKISGEEAIFNNHRLSDGIELPDAGGRGNRMMNIGIGLAFVAVVLINKLRRKDEKI